MSRKNPDFEIRVRTYRDSDSETVQELFKNAIIIGVDSTMFVALRAQFKTRFALASYIITSLGVFIATWPPTTLFRYLGFFLCFLGSTPFSISIYTLFSDYMNFANHAVENDLRDVPNVYGLTRATGIENALEYVTNGPNAFWVAEVFEAEGKDREVVGCIGLDISNMNAEDNAIELRRMAVSSKHRRQGIAGRLIKVAVAHAQAHDRRYIDLTTSSYKGALDLYEKYGWVTQQRWVLQKSISTHKLRLCLSDKI